MKIIKIMYQWYLQWQLNYLKDYEKELEDNISNLKLDNSFDRDDLYILATLKGEIDLKIKNVQNRLKV